METPFEIKRPDYCPYCDSDRSIELYNRYNKALRYTVFLDMMSSGKISELSKDYEYLKCKKCGIETDTPDMNNDSLPVMPLTNIRYKLFMINYQQCKGDM